MVALDCPFIYDKTLNQVVHLHMVALNCPFKNDKTLNNNIIIIGVCYNYNYIINRCIHTWISILYLYHSKSIMSYSLLMITYCFCLYVYIQYSRKYVIYIEHCKISPIYNIPETHRSVFNVK